MLMVFWGALNRCCQQGWQLGRAALLWLGVQRRLEEFGSLGRQSCLSLASVLPQSLTFVQSRQSTLVLRRPGLRLVADRVRACMQEAAVESTSRQLQLSCHIDKDVSFMLVGLERALQEEITKASATLGRLSEGM